jgi:hypothetical protein
MPGIVKKITNIATSVLVYFLLASFCYKEKNYFISNMDIHDINAHYNDNLYLPSTNSSIVQKGVLSPGREIYNHLPLNIKLLSKDIKQFKSLLTLQRRRTFNSLLSPFAGGFLNI